jgi:uncharacterized membrane protein YphA (DoxX/SURF4 family)
MQNRTAIFGLLLLFGNFERFAHAVHLAFVIVQVAIIAGGLTGPSAPDHFYPIS